MVTPLQRSFTFGTVLLALSCGAYLVKPIADPDLWWHLTIGRWIISHGRVPQEDFWNMFAIGTPWRAYSWSVEALFAFLDNRFGPQGLMCLKLVIAFSLALSLFYCLTKLSSDRKMGSLLGALTTLACFNHFTLRPQLISWLCFILVLNIAQQIEERNLSWRSGIGLFILSIVWANTNITPSLGIFAASLWIYGRRRFWAGLKVVLICFAGTLLTPYGGGEWLTVLAKTAHPFRHGGVSEFAPASVLQTAVIILLFELVLLGWAYHRMPRALAVPKLFMAAVFNLAALATVKFIPYAVFANGFLLALYWHRAGLRGAGLGNLGEGLTRLLEVLARIPKWLAALLLIGFCVWKLNWLSAQPLDVKHLPVGAVDFILERQLAHPILVGFDVGGYMMYRLSDRKGNLQYPVPIDGRTNVTPPHVWRNFITAFRGQAGWQEYFALVGPKTVLWKKTSPLISILLHGSLWCLVYEDGSLEEGYAVFISHSTFEERKGEFSSPNCR